MPFRRRALAAANSVARRAGLAISPVADDFDARLTSPALLGKMLTELADAATGWLQSQTLFALTEFDAPAAVEDFWNAYLHSPFRGVRGGSRFNNLLWLALIARAYQPDVIVDSGTFQGASAWAMAFGCPSAQLYSFDPDLSQIKLTVAASYLDHDWSEQRFVRTPSRGLCYFDDHIDQVRRLIEAHRHGFTAIFDDDYPVTSFAPMAHDGGSLPKIEFCLDDELRHEKWLTWVDRGISRSWPVDGPYLDRGRELISQTERLPNTSLVTGIHQTPYRLVRLVESDEAGSRSRR